MSGSRFRNDPNKMPEDKKETGKFGKYKYLNVFEEMRRLKYIVARAMGLSGLLDETLNTGIGELNQQVAAERMGLLQVDVQVV